MQRTASGTFKVEIQPHPGEARGGISRLFLDKAWAGGLTGHSVGEMLSVRGERAAVYVALESVTGELGGRRGSFVFAHLGELLGAASSLTYRVVPGTATGELAGLSGTLKLDIVERVHHYELTYAFPEDQ